MTRNGAWATALVTAAAFFVAAAPTLSWLEFSSSMENLTVATALEIRRSGNWLLPTLEGEPRIAKPPLAAWIAAARIRTSTLQHLDDSDPMARDAAYQALARDARLTALLASCVMLLAVFDLGKTIGGAPIGLLSMIVCGSSLYLLRFGRQATTDVQLALWVSVANAAIARLVLRGRSWPAAIVAGIALGLALMSKGPVALLQSVVAAAIFVAWRRPVRVSILQIIVGLLVMLAIGGAWYAYVAIGVAGVWTRWQIELLRSAPGEHSGNPLNYLSILLYMLPWSAALIEGAWRARRDRAALALLLVIVPIVLMSFFPDRQARYLLPLAGPAAVLAAIGVAAMLDPVEPRKLPAWTIWATVCVLGLGLVVAGATALRRVDGARWYPPLFAVCIGVVVLALLLILIRQSRERPLALVIGPAVMMMLLAPIFFFGYRDSPQGRSDMRALADAIRSVAPDASMYYWRPEGPKRGDVALSIYLNRPTVWIANPYGIEPPSRPQVLVTQHKPGDPPRPVPPGWQFIARSPRGNAWFLAFVRRPH